MTKSAFDQYVNARIEEQKDELYREAAVQYVRSITNWNVTIESFVDDLKAQGAWEHLRHLPLSDIAAIIRPAGRGAREGGKRLTKVEKAELIDRIPAFLESHPWTKRKDIASALHADARKLTGPLRELIAAKKLKKQGERGATVYAATGEKSKP